MGKFILFAVAAILSFALLFGGCTGETKSQAGGKNLTNGTAGEGTSVSYQPESGGNGISQGAAVPRQPQIPKTTDPAKQVAAPDTNLYNDTYYGISFSAPENALKYEKSAGCQFWGGSKYCIALFVDNRTRVKIAEYKAEPYDGKVELGTLLTKTGRLNRTDGTVWKDVWYANQKGLMGEFENSSVYRAGIYVPIAGSIATVEVYGNGTWKDEAKKMLQSVKVGGNALYRSQLYEFPCNVKSDCLGREICLSRQFCVDLNESDSTIVKYFNSSDACISGGSSVCKLPCETDADCPEAQRCTAFRTRVQNVVKENFVCD